MKTSILKFVTNLILCLFIFIGAFQSPVFTMIFSIAGGILFMRVAYNFNNKSAFAFLACSLTISVLFAFCLGFNAKNLCLGIAYFFIVALPGFAIGYTCKIKKDFLTVLVSGAISFLFAFITLLVEFKFVLKLDFIELFISAPIKQTIKAYKEAFALSGVEQMQTIAESLSEMSWYITQTITMIIPSVFIIICGLGAYFIFLAGRKFMYKTEHVILPYPHFHQLKMTKSATFIFAFLYIITMFMEVSEFSGAITNIIIVFYALFALCGLSFIDFYFRRKTANWILRIGAYFLASIVLTIFSILIPFANPLSLLLITAIFDSSRNFRRLPLKTDRIGGDENGQ